MAKASMVSRAVDAVAKGVAAIDESVLRRPRMFAGIFHDLSAISARLEDIERQLDRLEAKVGQGARRESRTATPKQRRASRRTKR